MDLERAPDGGIPFFDTQTAIHDLVATGDATLKAAQIACSYVGRHWHISNDPITRVNPTPTGGVQLEYETNYVEIIIPFDRDGRLGHIQVDSSP